MIYLLAVACPFAAIGISINSPYWICIPILLIELIYLFAFTFSIRKPPNDSFIRLGISRWIGNIIGIIIELIFKIEWQLISEKRIEKFYKRQIALGQGKFYGINSVADIKEKDSELFGDCRNAEEIVNSNLYSKLQEKKIKASDLDFEKPLKLKDLVEEKIYSEYIYRKAICEDFRKKFPSGGITDYSWIYFDDKVLRMSSFLISLFCIGCINYTIYAISIGIFELLPKTNELIFIAFLLFAFLGILYSVGFLFNFFIDPNSHEKIVRENIARNEGAKLKNCTYWYIQQESAKNFFIGTPEGLAGLAALVNAGNDFKGKTIYLTQDIALNDAADWKNWKYNPPKYEWIPIGNRENPFNGTFDGGGHVISGMNISRSKLGGGECLGLFGCVGSTNGDDTPQGTIKNLGVINSHIKSETFLEAGGLVGNLNFNGMLIDCYFIGLASEERAGGLVGSNAGAINRCYSKVEVSEGSTAGGLAGVNIGTINRCHSISNAAELVGENCEGSKISQNCYKKPLLTLSMRLPKRFSEFFIK
ncbi:MAG: hypothetical protein LBU89_11590 [Fibromonadaceae bacterium]|jgi:hypothetical protein|nr:hypothetical protein [Fibromonadaceae bacterium]